MDRIIKIRDASGNEISYCPFPIGSVISNALSGFDPNTLYKGTTWTRYAQGKVLVGVNENEIEFNTVGKTGGNKNLQKHNHTGTISSGGSHRHYVALASSAGSSSASIAKIKESGWSGVTAGRFWAERSLCREDGSHTHSATIGEAGTGNAQNLQPYVTVYMWICTA